MAGLPEELREKRKSPRRTLEVEGVAGVLLEMVAGGRAIDEGSS